MRGWDDGALAALQEAVDSAAESLGRCAAANDAALASTRPVAPAGFAEGFGELMDDPTAAFLRRTSDAGELAAIWSEERAAELGLGGELALRFLEDAVGFVDARARGLLEASEREAREWAAEILSVWDRRG